MIELVDFCKNYKKITACKNISFTCEDCQITGLLGPNGAGKSTILKAICGVHFPTSGKVFVETLPVEEKTVEAQKLIGYVSENADFPSFYTVLELLKEVGELRHKANFISDKNLLENQIQNVISLVDLKEVLNKKLSELSKGYKQRVSFALALIHNPKVLILDEPVSGLDPMQIVEIRTLIKKLSKEKTILLSTHLMQEAKELCDKIVILHKGTLIAKGTVEEICKKANTKDLEQAFLVLAKEKE